METTTILLMSLQLLLMQNLSSGAKLPPGFRSTRLGQTDNELQPNGGRKYFENRDWVKISQAPPAAVTQALGTSLVLECEAVGSPAPTMQWMRGNVPITELDDYEESNAINEAPSTGLVRVRSRLVVDNVLPAERSAYTCVARSGAETAIATSVVYSAPGPMIKPQNLTELLTLNNNIISGPQQARVVLYYSVVMETIGSSMVLPCRAVGRPRPEIFWLDNNENIITNQDPRFKTLPSGELYITSLRWADMGAYTCVARNPLAKDSVTTFIYPVLGMEPLWNNWDKVE
ncbi:neural/ectodermal development factor IMP-L2 isoform X2 [Ctenocephalides felis]|nr:neural/ectodermal development factor IMP-L2 isoform X2 [Ctenocephalides felis]